MAELSNLRSTLRRQSSPGSLVILVCAALVFAPRAWDHITGEPWIDNSLSVYESGSGAVVVEDLIHTREAVYGLRVNTVEGENSEVLCSIEHHNSWHGERKRFWRIEAFSGCEPQQTSYRVCSRFSVQSGSGRTQGFGPFCSPYVAATDLSGSSSR